MSYTNPSQTADYTLSEGTLVGSTIANSTAATGDVYAKNLTVDNAAVVVSNATIGAGGYINASAGAVFKNMTVLSGGTFARTAAVTLSGLTAASGAVLNYVRGGAIRWQGTWNIQSGANFGGYTNIYTDTDGWLNMNGRGMDGAIYCSINVKNITINSYLYHYGRVSSGTVTSRSDNGDALRMQTSAYAQDIRVLSGGSVRFYGVSATLRDVVADAGAKITLAANNWLAGRKTTFAKGFINDNAMANVYAQDGVIYNWTKPNSLGAFYFADVTLQDGDATNMYVYLGAGADTKNFTVGGAAGVKEGIILGQAGSAAAIDTTATGEGGGITVQSSYEAAFGGINNNVTAGHILIGAAGAGVANADLSIIGSEFNGLVVKSNTTKEYLVRPKVISGLNAVNPVVSSGGTLTVAEGGSATGAVVSADGRLSVGSGGWASGATVEGGIAYAIKGGQISGATVNAGVLYFWSGGVVSGVTINSGTLRAYKGGIASKVTLNGGYMYFMDDNTVAENNSHGRPAMIGTDIDIVAGSVFWRGSNASGVNIRISGGNGTHYVQNGAHLSGVSVYGGILTFEINGGINLKDEPFATYADGLLVAGGTVHGKSAAHISGATFTGGAFTLYNGAVLNQGTLNAGGTVSAWGSFSNLTMNGGTMSANGYMSGATVAGGTFNIYNYAKVSALTLTGGELTVSTGGSLSDATLTGGKLNVSSGGRLSDATLNQAGSMRVAGGGSATNLTVNGGASASILNLVGNGCVKGLTLTGTAGNRNYIYVYNTAVLEDVTVTSGAIYLPDGGTLRNLTQYGAGVPVMRGEHAYCSGATIYGGSLDFQNGAKGQDVVMHDGTTLNVMDNGYGWNLSNGIHGSGAKVSGLDMIGGLANVRAGGALEDVRISGGSVRLTSSTEGSGFHSAYISGATMTGGALTLNAKTNGYDVRIAGGVAYVAGAISGATMTAGTLNVNNGGAVSALAADGGVLNVSTGATGTEVTIGENGAATVAGTLNVAGSACNVAVANGGVVNLGAEETLGNANTVAGAHVNYVRNKAAGTIAGANTNIAASTFYYDGSATANGFSVVNGVVKNLGEDGTYYRLGVGSGIVVEDAKVYDGWRISGFGNAVVSGVNISAGSTDDASIVMRDDSVVYGGVLTGGAKAAVINLYENAQAIGTVIGSKGKVGVSGTAKIEDTTIKAGGQLVISAGCPDVDTGDRLTLDFTGTTGNQSVSINDLGSINAKTEIMLVGETAGNTYTIATTGSTDKYVNCGEWGLYDGRIKAGESTGNSFNGMVYSFDATGKAITTIDCTVGVSDTAESLDTATLVDCGYAAKWNADTAYSGSVTLANQAADQDVWLEIDGTNVSTALYGAEAGFQHGVNIYAKSGTIRNLAAGMIDKDARIEGDVKVTLAGADLTGTAYTGGFGSVMGSTETLITAGTFSKDFYAGALARYSHNEGILEGDTFLYGVALTVEGGTFSGNLYGASSVKANDITVEEANGFYVHSVADGTTVSLAGGTTTKSDFCCFAGGYATGNTSVRVYYVDGVTLDVSGGSWGNAHGGRGVFGGIMASGVEAAVTDVNLTISGGEMGNVYGGGWAQKGGKSIVGDVNISITGGTIANVFGGGSTSSSGGATYADDVTITISGGNITGAIYARGQLATDHVTGSASVTFTGANDYGCGVFGYTYVGNSDNDATLSFNGYTGTFSGEIGGFNGIVIDDDSAMTLTTAAADVSNDAWTFDVAARDAALSGTALLNWTAADFTGDTITLKLGTGEATEWSLVDAASTTEYGTFDVDGIASGLVLDQKITAAGDYQGWGFTLEDTVLKFKNLA